MMGMPSPGFGGGSFLGTAAATAAGMVGGSLLLSGIRNMMGGHQAFGDYEHMTAAHAASPWDSGNSAAGSDLAREAGAGDIGAHRTAAYDDPDRSDYLGGNSDDQSGDQLETDYDDSGDVDAGDFGGGDDFDTV